MKRQFPPDPVSELMYDMGNKHSGAPIVYGPLRLYRDRLRRDYLEIKIDGKNRLSIKASEGQLVVEPVVANQVIVRRAAFGEK